MPSAETTAVDSMLMLKDLCENCACLSESPAEPYILNIDSHRSGAASTVLEVSSNDGIELTAEVRGVTRRPEIIEAFANCTGAIVQPGFVICGAIQALMERGNNG